MASSSSSSSKKITLKSSDGENFNVDENAAMLSETIKHMIEDVGDSNTAIPLPNVTAKTLSKIIEYCNKHVSDDKSESEDSKNQLQQWDNDFFNVDLNTLFDLVVAANYMDIKSLLEQTCQCVADKIKDKTPEEVREIFNIKNDFTPEEEEEIRRKNQWAFE